MRNPIQNSLAGSEKKLKPIKLEQEMYDWLTLLHTDVHIMGHYKCHKLFSPAVTHAYEGSERGLSSSGSASFQLDSCSLLW